MAKRGGDARRQKSNNRSNEYYQKKDAQDAKAEFAAFTAGKTSYTEAEMNTYHILHNKMLKQTHQKQRSNNHSN